MSITGNEPQCIVDLFETVKRVAAHLLEQHPDDAKLRFWRLSGLESANGTEWANHQQTMAKHFPALEQQAEHQDTRSVKLILFLDEASRLIQVGTPSMNEGRFFQLVRQAGSQTNVQLVLADTHSIITNFISPNAVHASERFRHDIAKGTIPAPWITFNVIDYDDADTVRMCVGRKMPHGLDAQTALLLGRPLWQRTNEISLSKSTPLEDIPFRLREFAATKLLCEPSGRLGSSCNAITAAQALAMLAVRCVLRNISNFDYSTVVASHMATCTGTDESRERVFAEYFSEPVLSEASASLMHSLGDKLHLVLDHLSQLWREASSSAGDRGEITVQLLACLAKDQLVLSTSSIRRDGKKLFTAEAPALEFLKRFCELGACALAVARAQVGSRCYRRTCTS